MSTYLESHNIRYFNNFSAENLKSASPDIVVVGNAWKPEGLPAGVKGHYSPVNLGIPGGRTAGTVLVSGDCLFYLDDDAWLPTTDVVSRMLDILQARPEVGIVGDARRHSRHCR